jgi:predicted metal-dependent peptidase
MTSNLFKDEIEKQIVFAKTHLLFKHTFFGNIISHMELEEASDWCPTMATDFRKLYYNPEFVASLTKPELVFVLVHEVGHCILDHFGRRGERDPGLWNNANDYVVNGMLMKEDIGSMPVREKLRVKDKDSKDKDGKVQRVGLYDERFMFPEPWSSEQVYEDLKKRGVEVEMTMDMHLDLGADTGSGQKKVKVRIQGDGNGPPEMSEEELQQVRNEIRNAMINAAQVVGAGAVPASLRRLIADIADPQLDWRQMLNRTVQSLVKEDYSYTKPSRKCAHLGIILPGMIYEDTIEIHVGIDASASITEEMIRDFLTETKGIMDQFPDYKIHIWSFDTKVYKDSYHIFTPDNADTMFDYQWVKGGGGTRFEANWEFMRRMDMVPEQFVMFTDGLPNKGWGDPYFCDTLFIINNKGSKIEAPFGTTVPYIPSNGGS